MRENFTRNFYYDVMNFSEVNNSQIDRDMGHHDVLEINYLLLNIFVMWMFEVI